MSKVTLKTNAISQQVKAMIGEPIPANPILVLNAEALELLAEIGHNEETSNKTLNKSLDVFWANGVRHHHLLSYREKCEDNSLVEYRSKIIKGIIKGFDDKAQKLLNTPFDALSAFEQSVYKTLEGGILKNAYENFRKKFFTFEQNKEKQAKGESVSKAKPASDNVRALRKLNEVINMLSDSKTPYQGIVEDLKLLRSLAIFKQIKDPNPPKVKSK
jgi:hypothetical protein